MVQKERKRQKKTNEFINMAKARKIFVSLQWKDVAAKENKVRGTVERKQGERERKQKLRDETLRTNNDSE